MTEERQKSIWAIYGENYSVTLQSDMFGKVVKFFGLLHVLLSNKKFNEMRFRL